MVETTVDAKEMANKVTITVYMKHYRQFVLRNWIAARLIKLAEFISWAQVDIKHIPTEPYLYYCPKCKREVADFKPVVDRVIHCPHCHYQFIAVSDECIILEPDYKNEYDDYGCHWTEPYGFVPMAGCPRHD